MNDVGQSPGGNSQSDDNTHSRRPSFLARVDRWQAEALSALRRFYGTECEAGRGCGHGSARNWNRLGLAIFLHCKGGV
jgi:hypothetical protein